MLPKMPPKSGSPGFLYVPPFRVQGISVAGEQTVVQIPELDVCFDIGLCPRLALTSNFVAISHGHMDHVAGLPYYFSQRIFQGIGVGTCVCHKALAKPIADMMRGWAPLENQRTEHKIVGLEPDEQVEVKNNIMLRGIETSHTVPSMGYAVVERRSKLREEFANQPQEKLRELKSSGVEITRQLEIPLVAYTGDTEFGPFLFRDEFASAKIIVAECTFFEPDHRDRSKIGKHMHIDDIRTLLEVWKAEAIVLVHVSRRTNLSQVREAMRDLLGDEDATRVHLLMDHRSNKMRYERQLIELRAG
jgi:ribonuclease Z